MSRTRDRHGRGMRGPIAGPNPLTRAPVPLRRNERKSVFFVSCVEDAVRRIEKSCPDALRDVEIGVADVPEFEPQWAGDRALLAAAVQPTRDHPAQVVVFRRPLEHRADGRRDLQRLVYRTIVEQLSALTGLSIETIDPQGEAGRDDD
ncbi:metallopeptidase family protein [Propionicicella superfundia]|uniref:metallopeptidase family protein n=1 Tax=Propionicicella superfundia TaxID=348582 RepID=UPI00048E2511|nr:metallopeptidase family protein [Propionicicella superfundia]